jgi:hypothetical protein
VLWNSRSQSPRRIDLNRRRLADQLMATFSATARQHFTTISGRHARAEAVDTGAFQSAWLECSFHGGFPLLSSVALAEAPEPEKDAAFYRIRSALAIYNAL